MSSMLTGVLASMGGAPEPPKPATHPDLLAFYEAVVEPDVVGLNTSPDPDRVASWQRWAPDGKVSSTHVLAQGTEADQPDWDPSPTGLAKPAVQFIASRVTGLVDADAASLWTPLHDGTGGTIMMIVRPGANTGALETFLNTFTGSAGPGMGCFRSLSSVRFIIKDAAPTSIFDQQSSFAVIPADAWAIIVARFAVSETPDVDVRVNRTSELSGDVSSAPSSAAPAASINAGFRPAKTNPYNGHVHAIGFYDSYLSDADVTEYLEDWSQSELGV